MRNNVLNSAVSKVAQELQLDKDVVEKVYMSFWGFIRNNLDNLELKSISEEEFNALDTNFNIPYIGKLYTTYDKIDKYKRRLNYYNKYVKDKKGKANRQSGDCHKKCL